MASAGAILPEDWLPENNQFPKTTVSIINTEWNRHITFPLTEGCVQMLKRYGVSTIKVYTVPGAVEIPFAARQVADATESEAIITIGCVIKGDTPHFEYVCQAVTSGVGQLNTELDIPVIFGVLTVLTEEQALERCGGKHGHKGEEAAITALKMIRFMENLSH